MFIKSVLLSTILIVLSYSNAFADSLFFQPFSGYDYTLEAIFIGTTSMDWSQTQQITNNPMMYHEMNPILGRHPSLGLVNMYFPISIGLHALIAYALPKPYREVWQMGWIGIETGMVVNNVSIGLRIKF